MRDAEGADAKPLRSAAFQRNVMRIDTPLLVIAVLACGTIVRGQQVDPAPLDAPSKINADRLRWVQYKMMAGRVVASSSYPGTNMTFGPALVDGRRRERFEIHINQTQIDLQFELVSPEERLSIALIDGKTFTIRRTRSEPNYTFEFEQTNGQPLSVTITQGSAQRTLRGDSFWHLYLAEPDLIRRHLVPLLEILHPSWHLSSMGSAIEEALVERAQNPRPPDAERWLRWVDDLASPKFADRAGAERALQSAGQVILPFLQNLDRSRLDAEQASRVRAITESLAVGYEDSADRVATWLAGDEQIWLSLLTRGERVRRAAARQLGLLVGEPIDYDPAADEAARKLQVDRLRARLQKPAAREPAAEAPATKDD
jgi:hypothetical protein